jgi:hypothetical protein
MHAQTQRTCCQCSVWQIVATDFKGEWSRVSSEKDWVRIIHMTCMSRMSGFQHDRSDIRQLIHAWASSYRLVETWRQIFAFALTVTDCQETCFKANNYVSVYDDCTPDGLSKYVYAVKVEFLLVYIICMAAGLQSSSMTKHISNRTSIFLGSECCCHCRYLVNVSWSQYWVILTAFVLLSLNTRASVTWFSVKDSHGVLLASSSHSGWCLLSPCSTALLRFPAHAVEELLVFFDN